MELLVSGERKVLLFVHPADFGGMGRGSTFVLGALEGRARVHQITLTTPGRRVSQQGRLNQRALSHMLAILLQYVQKLRAGCRVVYVPIAQLGLPLGRDLFIVLLGRLARREVVVHLHGSMLARRLTQRGVFSALLRAALSRCRWLVLSEGVRLLLVSAGVAPHRVVIVRNAAPEAPTAAVRLEADTLRVGFLGAVCSEKGTDLAVDAVTSLRASGARVELVVAGPVADASVAPPRDGVTYLDHVPAALLDTAFWSRIDCLLIPSRWEEGLPFVALEALQRQVPVFSTYSAGLSELTDAGAIGLIEATVEDCARAVMEVQANGAGVADSQQQAWERLRPLYHPSAVARVLLAALES